MKFPRLFEPCKIETLELANRVVMPPMTTNFAREGMVTDCMVDYYAERGKRTGKRNDECPQSRVEPAAALSGEANGGQIILKPCQDMAYNKHGTVLLSGWMSPRCLYIRYHEREQFASIKSM